MFVLLDKIHCLISCHTGMSIWVTALTQLPSATLEGRGVAVVRQTLCFHYTGPIYKRLPPRLCFVLIIRLTALESKLSIAIKQQKKTECMKFRKTARIGSHSRTPTPWNVGFKNSTIKPVLLSSDKRLLRQTAPIGSNGNCHRTCFP